MFASNKAREARLVKNRREVSHSRRRRKNDKVSLPHLLLVVESLSRVRGEFFFARLEGHGDQKVAPSL